MKKQQERKPTETEELARRVERDHAHMSSAALESRLVVLACEADQLEQQIVALTAAVAKSKAAKAKTSAIAVGIGRILDKR